MGLASGWIDKMRCIYAVPGGSLEPIGWKDSGRHPINGEVRSHCVISA